MDPTTTAVKDPHETSTAGGGGHLVCVRCHHRITTRAARTEVGGGHEHRRSNPAGFHFRIGCFSAAPGCVPRGEISSHFTWFPGYSWQATICGLCEVHNGWAFRGGDHFYALILDLLRDEPEAPS